MGAPSDVNVPNVLGQEDGNMNWLLYYRGNPDGGLDFAEHMNRGGRVFLRRGKTFTLGAEERLPKNPDLQAEGYLLARSWTYNPNAPDYSALKKELESAIARLAKEQPRNAIAIVTDSDFMTVGLAVHSFPDIAATDDDALWIVDEWACWVDDDQLDPAYRWLLAYGYNCDDGNLPHDVFHGNVLRIFQSVLAELPQIWKIRLIYVGGDDCGHRWSAECMDKELSARMLSWI